MSAPVLPPRHWSMAVVRGLHRSAKSRRDGAQPQVLLLRRSAAPYGCEPVSLRNTGRRVHTEPHGSEMVLESVNE